MRFLEKLHPLVLGLLALPLLPILIPLVLLIGIGSIIKDGLYLWRHK